MSNEQQIIPERSRDIGQFMVGRLLPFRKKRMVGPFIFIDHIGPSTVGPGQYLDIGQHPHIGLSTLTYLFDGEIFHRDTIGSEQLIVPGSVNWMTAGKGVVHSERTPEHLRDGSEHTLHGFQIWVALPKALEFMEPQFHHVPENALPHWQDNGFSFSLIAGEAFGRKSPVPVHSALFMVELKTLEAGTLSLKEHVNGETGICVVKGAVEVDNQSISAGNMLVSKENEACSVYVERHSHLLLFGGEPFPEERYINWNFVATTKERIQDARNDWENGSFTLMPDEGDPIPLP